MLMKFRMAFVAPSSRVFGRVELVMDPLQIRKRYLRTDFIIDLLGYTSFAPDSSHVLGASCPEAGSLNREYWLNTTSVHSRCDARNDDSDFKFGMFADAFTSEVASSRFFDKYLYCLWWGLKNLSTYGQNLTTSTYIGETSFCIVLCIFGLILFAQLIGNMQTYLQSMTKETQGAETAVLLTGATIVDQAVNIALEPDYVLPPEASPHTHASENKNAGGIASSAVQKADVVSSMLAKGFILGKDALNKAKALDKKHQVISTATAKVASLDQKIGLSEKITIGATIVNDKVKEVDQKFQVTEKTKSAMLWLSRLLALQGPPL
ncbi:hypothetical protein CASFOL_042591 [Castilleja foliolosa]|uniref:Ion transport domain-containing protein n=1 Tax=Castilleja foliolosa TaxID=1961234 RepID=A0ABD3B893_9LAMI